MRCTYLLPPTTQLCSGSCGAARPRRKSKSHRPTASSRLWRGGERPAVGLARRACFGVLPKRVSAGRERSFSRRARAPRAMPRGRRPKNRQQIAPSFAVPQVRRPRSRGHREWRGAADPGDEDPGDERARNRPDPLSLGSALRGAALALLLCRERHDGSPAEARDSSVSRIAMVT